MTIASIVEKFAMDLGDQVPDRDSWFLDYVLRSPRQAGVHLTAGWLALNSLQGMEFRTCREYFGGMGAQALMVNYLFRPQSHWVHDYSEDAAEHLSRTLRPLGIKTSREDAYDSTRFPPGCDDLVMLDFGDLTAWKTRDGEQHRLLLDRVFAGQPKAVVFTDIAARYLHLHRERYEGLLGPGTCATYVSYLYALLARIQDLYGYVLVDGYWDRWSTVMALVPGDTWLGLLHPTPTDPPGLELL